MSTWINEHDTDLEVSEVGFLVLTSPQGRTARYSLWTTPAHTNLSGEPRLTGWCGNTNNTSVDAYGLAKVTKVARNGRRRIATVEPTKGLLEELGYPELMP
jgi:hypothetical protein